ncbi:MAG: hypothetical protein A2Y04_05310 [Omnitrophica WOR_2 bacterium GWC2_45_7]|nr:MAG: hypothetical protein A2Y04_05310 [Omnitrophica WOR_2 bacterium GWC2_45_7]
MARCDIVLADDHEMFREGLKSLLEHDSGFRVVGQAKDGEDLLSLLRKVKCGLVILDLSMPNVDGMTVIKSVREKYPPVKILVLTMQKDQEHFKHAMAYGANGYLLKEDAFDQLHRAIQLIMKGKRFVSSSVATLLADKFVRSLDELESPSLDILTKRELQILKLIAGGCANKNIAAALGISVRTVESHRGNLTNKLGIKSTAGVVKFAISKGLV